MIIDTHAHLNTLEFQEDIDQVVHRAKKNHIKNILVIGMDEPHNLKAIELAKTYDMLYATVGVHPGYVDEQTTDHLEDLLKSEKVVAVGECGIDLYWKQDNLDLQKKIFIEQIELSIKHDLPLVIHTRNSFNEAYECLLPYKGKARGVFHCFSSDTNDAKKAIELGFMIGIDGPVTFKNAKEVHELVEKIDLKHIIIETDSPYLAPHPYRGKRNEPSYLTYVAQKIAEIKGISFEEVAEVTSKNAIKLFRLGGSTL